jgi:PAS domain S-box-containing protein
VGAASPFRLAASIRTDPGLLWQRLYANRDETGAYRQPLFRRIRPIITSWNPAAEQTYGYSSKDIIGTSGRFLLPEDRAGELNAVLAWIKQGQVIEDSLYSTLPRKDGTQVPISISISPIRDAEGAVVGVVSVHRDMTEQQQALEAAQRMASIINYSDDAIIGSTLEGIITSWDPAAERLFGYSSEEISGTAVAVMSRKDRLEGISGILAKVRAGEHIHHLETNAD